MKSTLLLPTIFILLSIHANAQSSLNFTVSQPPLLVIDAGKDSVAKAGDKIRLGGTIVASGGSGIYQYAWFPATGLDSPNIARPLATIDTTITYQLTVEDAHTCKKAASVKITSDKVTAIPNIFTQSGILVFPNPAKGIFYVLSEKPVLERIVTIELFDLYGRKVYTKSIKGNRKLNEEIRMFTGASGMYMLKVTGSKNYFAQKIIFL